MNLALVWRRLGRLDLAEAALLLALQLVPTCHVTLSSLGFVLHLQCRFREAIERYHAALAFVPDDAFITFLLADVLRRHAASAAAEGLVGQADSLTDLALEQLRLEEEAAGEDGTDTFDMYVEEEAGARTAATDEATAIAADTVLVMSDDDDDEMAMDEDDEDDFF